MKIYKIFALPSHTFVDKVSGTDYVRVIQPLKYLDGYKDKEVEFQVKVYDHSQNKSFDWRDIFRDYDAIYFNYTSNDVGYAIMGLLAQKYNRKLICDIDDDIFNILPNNPAHEVFKKGAWGNVVVRAVLEDVAHVTCTNSHLKHSLEFNAQKMKGITVIPNYIDLSLYKYRCKFKDRGYYKALHFGSSTHHGDLYSPAFVEGLDRIMKEYPNFTFTTIGSHIPRFKNKWGIRYEIAFGHQDLFEWIKMMPEIMDDTDFMLVPLDNNTYTRSKSSIKRWEVSSYKIPFIGQKIRQYNEVVTHGVDGLLCSTADEWYSAIKLMLDNPSKRKEFGEAGYKRTVKEAQIQNHLEEYSDMLKKVLT